jgi:hypothetical protein
LLTRSFNRRRVLHPSHRSCSAHSSRC